MRFDPKEINPANLGEIAKHIDPKSDLGPKLQALQALALFGERAGDQCADVVKVLGDDDTAVISTALGTLGAMGIRATGAVPELLQMETKWEKLRDERMKENLKDKQFLDFYSKLEAKEKQQVIDSLPEEQTRRGIAETIKWIRASKEGKPGGDLANAPATPAPEPKKAQ
jgi:hypothetical protein